jgi:hypothetical protein
MHVTWCVIARFPFLGIGFLTEVTTTISLNWREEDDKSHVSGKWGSDSQFISQAGEGSSPSQDGTMICSIPLNFTTQLVQNRTHSHYTN